MIKRLFGLILASILLIAGCQSIPTQSQAGKHEASSPLTIRLAGKDWGYPQPYTRDPRGPGFYNMCLIFDSLLEKNEKGMIPWLAKDWKVSGDGKVYTFILEDGVKWQDGKPFTAQDVKFTFEYFGKKPPVGNDLVIGKNPFIQSIEVVSDTELKVTVDTPNATILERLGYTRIIPEHIWKDIDSPAEFMSEKALIGTGPYILTHYDKAEGSYRFEAWPGFWGPKQRVQVIEHVPVSDTVMAFENGKIDYAAISPDVVSRFSDTSKYKLLIDPPFNGVRLLFNMTGALADKSLRQAIAYAVNQNEIVEKVARGAGIPGNAGYVPDGSPYTNEAAYSYAYDPEKAKALLGGQTYSFSLQTAEENVKVAELLKLYLQAVGINVKVEAGDLKTIDNCVNTGNYELILQSVGGYGEDPDYLRELFHTKTSGSSISGAVLPGYSNPELDALADRQLTELDEAQRRAMIYQLQEMIAQDVPVYTLYNKTGCAVYMPEKYDGWMYMYDHQWAYNSKLSYLERTRG